MSEMTAENLLITVAVPTYLRPDLIVHAATVVLEQLSQVPGGEMLVIDNDPAGSGVQSLQQAGLLDHPALRAVIESRPGVAAVRNRALDECAQRDLLAFVDDDEEPSAGWLQALLDTRAQTGAAAVVGRVIPRYEHTPDPWIEAGGFFVRKHYPTGTLRPAAATNNLLLDLRELRALGLRFNEDFGATGGEDTLLTRSLVAAGKKLVWCDEAICTDLVPAERATRPWVLRRARSHANTSVRVELALQEGKAQRALVRARAGVGGILRAGVGVARQSLGTVARRQTDQARGARLRERGIGMLAGALGQRGHQEYQH